jgi:hypothetical protein
MALETISRTLEIVRRSLNSRVSEWLTCEVLCMFKACPVSGPPRFIAS